MSRFVNTTHDEFEIRIPNRYFIHIHNNRKNSKCNLRWKKWILILLSIGTIAVENGIALKNSHISMLGMCLRNLLFTITQPQSYTIIGKPQIFLQWSRPVINLQNSPWLVYNCIKYRNFFLSDIFEKYACEFCGLVCKATHLIKHALYLNSQWFG